MASAPFPDHLTTYPPYPQDSPDFPETGRDNNSLPGPLVQRKGILGGSGVIVDARGCIVTSAHVVDGAESIRVTLFDRSEHAAVVIDSDPRTDLAVLKIDTGVELPYATFGDSEAVRVGDRVVTIENPV